MFYVPPASHGAGQGVFWAVAHIFNGSPREAEVSRSFLVQDHPGLHGKMQCEKQEREMLSWQNNDTKYKAGQKQQITF